MNEPKLVKTKDLTELIVNKQKKILIIAICFLITLFFGSSYALLTNFDKTDNVITINSGNLTMTINNTEGLINLNNKLPESDTNGLLNSTPIVLVLTNTGTLNIGEFKMKLISEKDTNNITTLEDEYIKYAISTDGGINYTTGFPLTANDNVIYSDSNLDINKSTTIYLKIWIDENAGNNAINKTYYGSIEIELYQKSSKNIIKYDANGGSYTPDSTMINSSEQTKITLAKPVKDDLNFLGWSTNPEATTPEYYSGDSYAETDSVNLYAIYGNVQNKMGELSTNLNLVPYNTSISEINFVNMNQDEVNNTYNNASIKFDFTAEGSNNGSVLGWLTTDSNDNSKYILTIASTGTTYFTTGDNLFNGWNYQQNANYNFINLKTINLTNVDTKYVTSMRSMFSGCQNLTNLDLSGFNTNNVENMSLMLDDCISLTNLNISNFNLSNSNNILTNYESMFSSVSSNCQIIVKDNIVKQWLINNTGRDGNYITY